MSLINEALRKAEQDRAAQRLAVYPGAPTGRRRRSQERSRTARFLLWSAPVVAVVGVVALALFLRRPASPAVDATAAPEIATASGSAPAFASSAPEVNRVAAGSPFADASTETGPPAPPPASDYELAGMTALGDNTLISVMRRSDQRSVWIPIGKSVGEITAVSYNALSDEAVIRVHGELLTVGMRSGPLDPGSEPAPQAAE